MNASRMNDTDWLILPARNNLITVCLFDLLFRFGNDRLEL